MGLAIRLESVTHHYGGEKTGVTAIRDLSLKLAAGSFTAVMGASGSGKSTLLHLIGAVDRASTGNIVLGERQITGLSEKALTLVRREQIGFVFQFFNLIPTLTVRENIRFPLDLNGEKGNRDSKVNEVLERIGLTERQSHYPNELSGGEMQRVAIGRAIAHRPPILLTDEPTGNLDSRTGQSVLELIRDLHRENNLTVVMATHSDRAAAFAETTLQISDGRLTTRHGDAG